MWRLFENLKSSVDVTLVFFAGKRIALLGQQAVGKTRLLNYILKNILPIEEYTATHKEKFNSVRNRTDSLNILLKGGSDVGGSAPVRDSHWRDACNEADVVCYLVRADILLNEEHSEYEDHVHRIEADIDLIIYWLKEERNRNFHRSPQKRKLKKSFIYIATHSDNVSRYSQARDGNALREKLYEHPLVGPKLDEISTIVRHRAFIFGNTATKEDAVEIKRQIVVEGKLNK